MPHKYLTVEGIATWLHHRGPTTLPEVPPDLSRGQALLCLHGEGGNGAEFDAVLDRLAERHSPLAVDLPAHGRSAGLDSLPGIEAMAEFVGGVAQKLGLGPHVAVGHSLGGIVAQVHALEHPDALRGLVLIGAGASGGVPAELLERWRLVSQGKRRRAFPRELYAPDAPREVLGRGFAEWIKTDPRALYGDLLALARFAGTLERLPALAVPCLSVVGEHEPDWVRESVSALTRALPAAKHVVISGAGHQVPIEQPEALADAIAAFVEELPR
ncbi:MAG: alpha/beta fold hydrolase [Myxococcota bacterium]